MLCIITPEQLDNELNVIEKKFRNRQRKLERMRDYNNYKKNLKCVICNSSENITFHHREHSQKSFSIANEAGRISTKRLFEEIAKCDPICRNCHDAVEKTYKYFLSAPNLTIKAKNFKKLPQVLKQNGFACKIVDDNSIIVSRKPS